MQGLVQIFAFIIIGVVLVWFGYNLFFGLGTKNRRANRFEKVSMQEQSGKGSATPGEPQVCPICSSKLDGDLVRTLAYPSITGGKDRLMHIRGCMYCIEGNFERYCPVCSAPLAVNEVLVARMFDRPHHRPHVHVLGCIYCRRKLG